MCGIMGFIQTGARTIYTKRIITETFRGLGVRGTDAAGWGILGDGQIATCKAAVSTKVIAQWKGYKRRLPTADLMIGHARSTVMGDERVNKNNHPHCSKHLANLLIHNGIIYERWGEFLQRSDCDSEILLRMIETLGMKKACKEMANFDFSWFAWLNMVPKEKAIYAYRDDSSPCGYVDLSFAAGGTLIASTFAIVEDALERVGIEIPDLQEHWTPLEPFHLYRWQIGTIKPKVTKIALPKSRPSSYGFSHRIYGDFPGCYNSAEYSDRYRSAYDDYDDWRYGRSWFKDKYGVWKQRQERRTHER